MFIILLALLQTQNIRYLSVPDKNQEKYLSQVSFVLNSLSKRKTITKPKLVTEDKKPLIQFNLDDYDIKPENYDKLKNVYEEKYLRADWFIANALIQPNYTLLLEIENLKFFEELTHVKENVKTQQKAIITNSVLARNERTLQRSPTLNGYYWKSFDSLAQDNKSFEVNLLNDKYDAIAHIATLPNGLQIYFLSDSKGNKLNFMNPEIAIDNIHKDLVYLSTSCIGCHHSGVMPFKDMIRDNMRTEVALFTKDPRILDWFSGDIYKNVKKDQEIYKKAIKLTNDLDPKTNALQFLEIVNEYNAPVDKKKAAKELKMTEEELENKAKMYHFLELSEVLLIFREKAIRRDQFEVLYKKYKNQTK